MLELTQRAYNIIDLCWQSFSAKAGYGVIDVNKEASMQLQFAYLLKNSLDLIIYEKDENAKIELEGGIPINGRLRECDLQLHLTKNNKLVTIPIEMKCYKTFSSSGGRRGAQDLFRYGIYEDLELLESYVGKNRNLGIFLAMTDSRNFVYPKSKEGKSWAYDISEGTSIKKGINLNTPIGGNTKNINLKNSYDFAWNNYSDFYFLKLQGTP